MKKAFLGIIGLLLVAGTINGGGVSYLTNWSTGELIGGNTTTIIMILLGIYLIYYSFK